jgi:hypothetical protein
MRIRGIAVNENGSMPEQANLTRPGEADLKNAAVPQA